MEFADAHVKLGADCYYIFAFDEGTPAEIIDAQREFNLSVRAAYEGVCKDALMKGFHRPTAGEFREAFIDKCRDLLRRQGKI